MLTDDRLFKIRAEAEEVQLGGSQWSAVAGHWTAILLDLCDHVDSLKSALEGVESVRQMQVRNIETLTDERDELKLALRIMLASHSDWVNINEAERDYFEKKYILHREASDNLITYSITRVDAGS